MKLDALQVEIRQRSVGQVVSTATRFLQHRPLPLLSAWLLFSGPMIAGALGLLLGLGLAPAAVWAAVLLATPLFSLPMVATVGYLVFSPSVTLPTVLGITARRSLHFLTLLLLQRVAVLLGLLALIVPGLYLWRSSWFLAPIVVLERSGLRASLRRTRHFAAGENGRVTLHGLNVGALVGYWTLALALLGHFVLGRVLAPTIEALGELSLYDGYWHALALTGFALAVPLATLVWFFVYLDVRTRKEGWDLEIAFRTRALELAQERRGG